MKNIILLASALAFGGTAYAQDTTQPPMTPDATAPAAPATPDPAMTPPAAPDAAMAPPADPSMASPPAGSPTPPPMGGGMQPGMATGPSGPVSMTPSAGPTDLPKCSKSVTDNCTQGGGKAMGHHMTKKHKK